MKKYIILFVMFSLSVFAYENEMHEWVSKSGDKVIAAYQSTKGSYVNLKSADGKIITIKESAISEEDIAWLSVEKNRPTSFNKYSTIKIKPEDLSTSQWRRVFTSQISNCYARLNGHTVCLKTPFYDESSRKFEYDDSKKQILLAKIMLGDYVIIKQKIDNKHYLASNIDNDTTFLIETIASEEFYDNQKVRIPRIETGKIYEYISVMNANKRVPIMQQIPRTTENTALIGLTFEQFIDDLHNGYHFIFVRDLIPRKHENKIINEWTRSIFEVNAADHEGSQL